MWKEEEEEKGVVASGCKVSDLPIGLSRRKSFLMVTLT